MAQKINILLAEDDKNLGVILKKYLEAKDMPVTLCADGEEALKAFKDGNFNFCIFDVTMPLMDGFTLAKVVKKLDRRIPIIFLTARSDQKDIIEDLPKGAIFALRKALEEKIFSAYAPTAETPYLKPNYMRKSQAERMKDRQE